MFPLTPNEAVFFDQLGRYFPDWREVTEGAATAAPIGSDQRLEPVAPSVTSHQSALFDNTREAA